MSETKQNRKPILVEFTQDVTKKKMMTSDYGLIGFFLLGGVAFALISLLMSWMVRPHKRSARKESTYECGVETQGTTWVQFKIQYFLYALVFVAFDVETIFLFPWAVAFRYMGLFAFVEMIVFVAILAIGLWYVWQEGALEWS